MTALNAVSYTHLREAILPFQGDIQVEAFSAQNKIGIDKLAAKLDGWFAPLFS